MSVTFSTPIVPQSTMNVLWHCLSQLSIRLAVVVTLGILVTNVYAAENAADQVWLVSTRGAPLYGPADPSAPLECWRLGPDNNWLPSDENALRASDASDLPTCIFIHGNRVAWQDGADGGWQAYEQIKQQAQGRPLRMIIWSWPSERVSNRIRIDAQEKAARSDGQAIYLAEWLRRVPPAGPLCLIGYSFGARVVTGALHRLGGGDCQGQPPRQASDPRAAIRAVLVAGAEDCDWLLTDHCHGLALSQLDRVLITVNRCDPALRWYRLMDRRGGADALGYAGLCCPEQLGADAAKVEQIDVTCEVGKAHDWCRYILAPSLAARLGRYTFLAP